MTALGRGWVAYVGPFKYPTGEAASRRVAAMAATIARTGRRVVVVSGSASTDDAIDGSQPPGDITHVTVPDAPNHYTSPGAKADVILRRWGEATVEWLDQQPVNPTHVVVYGGLALFGWRILRWCRRHGVEMVVDVVEWHSPKQLAGGALGPFFLSSEVAMRHVYPKADAAICISTFLGDHFEDRGVRVAVVPPTVTHVTAGSTAPDLGSGLRLLYFGSAGRKDRVDLIVQAVQRARASGEQVDLTLAGSFPADLRLGPGVTLLGRLPSSRISTVIAEHHFTVILRERQRFTTAGFPTKFVESLANGVPVLTNLTSDIGAHSEDGVEALYVLDCTVEAMQAAIHRACSLDQLELQQMRDAARERALNDFMYTAYVDPVEELLGGRPQ